MLNPGLIDGSVPASNDCLNILGVGISLINIEHGIKKIKRSIVERSMKYNFVAAVLSAVSSHRDPELKRIPINV